jgi:dipeptidyl aminopeptidase/acylaminoacyl peptidase
MRRAVFFLVLTGFFSVCFGPNESLAQKRPMTFDEVVGLKRASDPRLSPDGSKIAFVVTEWDKERDAFNGDIYLVAVAEGVLRRLTQHPDTDQSPRWSPDGSALAFLSNRQGEDKEDKKVFQIYLWEVGAGEPRQLSFHEESITALEWSPDGRTLAFLAPEKKEDDEAKKPDKDKKAKTPKPVVVDEDPPNAHLWLLDVASQKAQRLTQKPFHLTDVSFSPDGKSLAYVAQISPKVADALSAELYVVSVQGGEPRRLTSNGFSESHPRWSPDGSRIAYLSEADGNPAAGPSRIHVISASGGEAKVLARSFDGYIRDFFWSKEGSEFIFEADIRVNRHLYRVADTDGEPEALTRADGLNGSFSLDRARSGIAFLREDPENPADVWFMKEGSGRKLTDLNPQAAAWALGKVETIRWKSSDGMEIEGLVVYPVDYRPGRRYPTVLEVHGGPEGAYTRGFLASSGTFPQVYAASGYVTLLPNFRGSSNYGARFAQANRADVGGGDYQDCMTGVDHLVAQGIADPDRLAIKGWSYGGYMSGWTIGHTTRFKAAAYGAGLSNAVSYYGTADIQFSRENLHGGTPYSNRKAWEERSPLSYVANVKTPALIFHGEKDERVPVGQSYEFYMGLRKHNVPSKLVVYPGQPHGLRVPSYQLDKMRREFEWIEKYLGERGRPTEGGPRS